MFSGNGSDETEVIIQKLIWMKIFLYYHWYLYVFMYLMMQEIWRIHRNEHMLKYIFIDQYKQITAFQVQKKSFYS